MTQLGVSVATKLERQLNREERKREPLVVRASELGTVDVCVQKFWFRYHHPEVGEPISGQQVFKFYYGDVIEDSVLALAKAAGHKVECEQAEVVLMESGLTIIGKCDAVIDGVLVDVKSTTPYGFKDFVAGKGGDKFGYRAQLNVYAKGLGIKRKGFVVVDKQLGKMAYCPEDKPYDVSRTTTNAFLLANTAIPYPKWRLPLVRETNGNHSLGLECSYCEYKKECWKAEGVRTFAYSNGPKYLVGPIKVLPKVPEVT